MTNREAINWLINVTADIGKVEHQDLWHYEQALSEIREMLESAPEPCKDAVSREAVLSDLKRWIGYLDEDMIERMGIGMKKLPSVQPEPKWIPCSDKIPSEAQECWITAKDGTVCQGMFTRQYGERRDSGFICNNGFAWLNTVVAWMPYDMPEPYQKEGE